MPGRSFVDWLLVCPQSLGLCKSGGWPEIVVSTNRGSVRRVLTQKGSILGCWMFGNFQILTVAFIGDLGVLVSRLAGALITKLFRGIVVGISGFWSPIVLPLSSNNIYGWSSKVWSLLGP